jgi:hypothetical protein
MSGSEALPALETTRFEGGTPGSSLHAMTEAVTALPTSNLRLVCPFHDPAIRRRVEEAIGYEVCGSYVKASRSRTREPTLVPSPVGPRRIRIGREKNPCVIRRRQGSKIAWQTMEKPFPTWGFLVER